jgi:hypothetical protein
MEKLVSEPLVENLRSIKYILKLVAVECLHVDWTTSDTWIGSQTDEVILIISTLKTCLTLNLWEVSEVGRLDSSWEVLYSQNASARGSLLKYLTQVFL